MSVGGVKERGIRNPVFKVFNKALFKHVTVKHYGGSAFDLIYLSDPVNKHTCNNTAVVFGFSLFVTAHMSILGNRLRSTVGFSEPVFQLSVPGGLICPFISLAAVGAGYIKFSH